MNCFNVKLYGYCNKLLSLYNYILTDMGYFKQKYVNFTLFIIIHPSIWMHNSMLKSQRKPNPNGQTH